MDIKRLETFCAVYERKSFSKAAESLYLAQPTISAHIAALEEELGVAVFDRLGRTVQPTQAGELLYSHAQDMIQKRDQAITQISMLMGKVTGQLRVGGSTIPGHYILPPALARLRRTYPGVRVSLEIDDSLAIEEQVGSGYLDLGVIGGREGFEFLTYREVARDECILIASAQEKERVQAAVAQHNLQSLPWLVREAGSGTRKTMLAILQQQKIGLKDLQVVGTVSSTESIVACVRAGMGVSILSSLAAAGPLSRGEVQQVQLPAASLERRFYAVTHSHRMQFPATKAFLQLLQQTANGPDDPGPDAHGSEDAAMEKAEGRYRA